MTRNRSWWSSGTALILAVFVSSLLALPLHAATSALPVTLASIVGMPADSPARGEFMEAFRAAMDAELPCEKRSGDTWTSSGPRRNAFRLVDVAAPDEAWSLELSLGAPTALRVARPAPRHRGIKRPANISEIRSSRGLTIVVSAQSPGGAANGAEPRTARFTVYFADARRVVVPTERLPGGGYAYPWDDAGTVVARAALEVLHRANGALADDERADLSPATRTPEAP